MRHYRYNFNYGETLYACIMDEKPKYTYATVVLDKSTLLNNFKGKYLYQYLKIGGKSVLLHRGYGNDFKKFSALERYDDGTVIIVSNTRGQLNSRIGAEEKRILNIINKEAKKLINDKKC